MKKNKLDKKVVSKIWDILTKLALNKQPICYSELAEMVGIDNRHTGSFLGVIQTFCINNNFPAMTIIVVNKGIGEPGTGFDYDYIGGMGEYHIKLGIEKTYNFNWNNQKELFEKYLETIELYY